MSIKLSCNIVDDNEVVRNAKAHSSQEESSLFESALGFLNNNKVRLSIVEVGPLFDLISNDVV